MRNNFRVLFCLIPVTFAAACADVSNKEIQSASEPIASTTQAATGSNPLIDAEYVGEISIPDGMSYVDMAMYSNQVFLTRSDGRLQYYNFDGTNAPVYAGYVADSWDHLEWINYSDWGLIASSNARKKLYYKANNVPRLLGNYPAGVTLVSDVAARARSTLLLDIWIVYSQGSGSPASYIRYGQYSKLTGVLTWSATPVLSMAYYSGFAYGAGPDGSYRLYSTLNYINSYFMWFTPQSNGDVGPGASEGNFPYTEHAYLHPEGAYDRFAPIGLHYLSNDNKYYGIDYYANTVTGRRAWVFARIPASAIRP